MKEKSVKPEEKVVMVRFSAEDDLALLCSVYSHGEKAFDRIQMSGQSRRKKCLSLAISFSSRI